MGGVERGFLEKKLALAAHNRLCIVEGMKKTDSTVSTIAALLGARGGKARTPKKIRAARANVKKATAARLRLQPS